MCIRGISDKEWRFEGTVKGKKECASGGRTKASGQLLTRGNNSRIHQHLDKSLKAGEKDEERLGTRQLIHGLKRRCVGTGTDWGEKTLETSHVLSSATQTPTGLAVVETRKSGGQMPGDDCQMTAER